MRSAAAVLVAAVSLVAAGCGEKDEPEPEPRPTERAQAVPKPKPGWTTLENGSQGFALNVPPGWKRGKACRRGKVKPFGAATLVCSPDRLVTLSVSADRTEQALELDPRAFAERTLASLDASYEDLKAGPAERFAARYRGAIASASGEALPTGVQQDIDVVVLRRADIANFTALVAANARQPTGPAVRLAKESLRTLRSQPVRVPPAS